MEYISNTKEDHHKMLDAIGVESFESLVKNIPEALRGFQWGLSKGMSELELDRYLDEIGHANKNFKYHICYLGAGVYDHFIPAAVNRIASRGEYITAYTPYQGEASQGSLQVMYEYQSMICELTGMDYSNASMYDGGSSLAEAVLLAMRYTDRKKILISEALHPEYKQIIRTYTSCTDCEIVEMPTKECALDKEFLCEALDENVAALVVQQPNFFGVLEDHLKNISEKVHGLGGLLIACVNPISLGLLSSPGEYDADIAVGEGQSLGNTASFGGPHFGFFTVKEVLLRKIPGRIAGMTVDKTGKRAFALTLQAREQHIRREKATSNICTNQALCALKATVYLALLGKAGLKKLSLLNYQNAHEVYRRILKIPAVSEVTKKTFFNEFPVQIEKDPKRLRKSLKKYGILGPLALEQFYPDQPSRYLFAVTEKRTNEDLEKLVRAIEECE